MSRELERLVRFAYASVEYAERGELTRQELERLGTALQGAGDCLRVAALWTAARAAMLPQLQDASLATATVAVQAVTETLGPPAADVFAATNAIAALRSLLPQSAQDPMVARRASAAGCVASALDCALYPSPALFADVVQRWALATRDPADSATVEQARWTAWLDDIVTRANRFSVLEALALFEKTLQGTIRGLLPNRYVWEGVADVNWNLEVWSKDPTTNKLVMRVLKFASVNLVKDVVHVVIASDPKVITDRLRVEHLFEHEVHRQMMNATYEGKYQAIDYAFAHGTDHWQAPV